MQILNTLAGKNDAFKGYKTVQIINSFIGLEIVLAKEAAEAPMLFNLLHANDEDMKPMFTDHYVSQCMEVQNLVRAMTEDYVGCMDLSRPSLWYSSHLPTKKSTGWVFAGLHTFFKGEDTDKWSSVLVTLSPVPTARFPDVHKAELQLVSIVSIIQMITDCYMRNVAGLRDQTCVQTMIWDMQKIRLFFDELLPDMAFGRFSSLKGLFIPNSGKYMLCDDYFEFARDLIDWAVKFIHSKKVSHANARCLLAPQASSDPS